MSLIAKCIYALVLTGVLIAAVQGETNADPVLKKSVTDLLKRLENAYYSCSPLRLRVTDTGVTIPFDGTRQQEKWEVLSCNGETHSYEVTFTPRPGGGTSFGIRKWPE
jgi:hypothetical protein